MAGTASRRRPKHTIPPHDPEEWAEARRLVLLHGTNATAYQILNPGFTRWFDDRREAVVGYVTYAGHRVVAGAPIAAPERLAEAVASFEDDTHGRGRRSVYFAAEDPLARLLERRGPLDRILLGAQPVWDPASWPGILKRKASLRAQLHRARNKGVRVKPWPAERAAGDPGLERCLEEWLEGRGLPPLHFLIEPDTLGRLHDRRVFVAAIGERAVGLLVVSPVPRRGGLRASGGPQDPVGHRWRLCPHVARRAGGPCVGAGARPGGAVAAASSRAAACRRRPAPGGPPAKLTGESRPYDNIPKAEKEYPMRRILATALLLTTTLVDGAVAADAYRFAITYDHPGEKTRAGSALVDGIRYRVELPPSDKPRPYDVILSVDGGQHEKALNLDNGTFYDLKPSASTAKALPHLLFFVKDSSITDPKVESWEEDGEALAGYPTRKVNIRYSYDFHTKLGIATIDGKIQSTTAYWLADSFSLTLPVMLQPKVETGFPEIDEPLAELLSGMHGFPLRMQISTTTQLSGEKPETSVRTRTIDAIQPVESTPGDFEVPEGFIYQEPVWTTPDGGKIRQ